MNIKHKNRQENCGREIPETIESARHVQCHRLLIKVKNIHIYLKIKKLNKTHVDRECRKSFHIHHLIYTTEGERERDSHTTRQKAAGARSSSEQKKSWARVLSDLNLSLLFNIINAVCIYMRRRKSSHFHSTTTTTSKKRT